jgi:hypothetical protein
MGARGKNNIGAASLETTPMQDSEKPDAVFAGQFLGFGYSAPFASTGIHSALASRRRWDSGKCLS